jgi:uncharacterized heparinase superfamily protein
MRRLWRTARWLRREQLVNRIWRSLRLPLPVTGTLPARRPLQSPWNIAPARPSEWLDSYSVRILGQIGTVCESGDWQHAFGDDLRLYHLHYLNQLCAETQPAADFPGVLLGRWVTQNPPGSKLGWEPYPTSRRLVNAFKALLAGVSLPQTAVASLADQCRCLVPALEFHLLGNHLLANAKALMFAAAYFCGPEADAWQRHAGRILAREVREQVLADGGHIERSPLYHALVLEDLLDLVNLRATYGLPGLDYLDEACSRMLAWHGALCHPDGEIALINDAVIGVATPSAVLAAYAGRLGLTPQLSGSAGLTLLRASGFAVVKSGPWSLFADVGSVGPAYQPGHAHAGTLTFELSMGHERVVVDTGVSTYQSGQIRTLERSTRAHNTVSLDGGDSSEVWGAFRVADRARVTQLEAEQDAAEVWIRATHDGYRRSRYRALHSRRWQVGAQTVDIEDCIQGIGAPRIEIAVHFHPECSVRMVDGEHVAVTTASGAALQLLLDPALRWHLEGYCYAPTFGVRTPAVALKGAVEARLPHALRTRIAMRPDG